MAFGYGTGVTEYQKGLEKSKERWERFLQSNSKAKSTAEQRNSHIVVGLPGVGKSQEIDIIVEQNSNNLPMSMDNHRGLHPNYKYIILKYGIDSSKYTKDFAQGVVDGFIERAVKERYNIVVETTFGSKIRAENRIAQLLGPKDEKINEYIDPYNIQLTVLVRPVSLCLFGVIERYDNAIKNNDPGRYTYTDDIDKIAKVFPNNLAEIYETYQKYISRVEVKNYGVVFWNNYGEKYKDISLTKAVKSELNRQLTIEEICDIRDVSRGFVDNVSRARTAKLLKNELRKSYNKEPREIILNTKNELLSNKDVEKALKILERKEQDIGRG
ncbi:MAG: zeta toxin family protein [Helicobacteraceae bacterium]|jgi:UDP-N-acetylglucosamine kinase|nr:zeta toxin family protein [Helicobacteraceae bacterium]